jgi:Ser/Thr protein kinase RdoA (MazF antagonist)
LQAATVASWLAADWALPGVTVVPHEGGMNSQTWLVSDGVSRWVAKAVPSAAGLQLAGGVSVAARVQAAGIPAGTAVPTTDGRSTVTRDGRTLALLTFVEGVGLTGKGESEQRLIGTTLARAHTALVGLEIPSADRFHWLDPEADHLGIRPWIRPAIADALAGWERLVPTSLTWGLIHSDPAPEAFLVDRSTGVCGLIDWDRALVGPLMYDLASAVMYLGGPRHRTALVDGYATLPVLAAAEIERTLVPMFRLRLAVQADYFARRIAMNDMTGITDASENEDGLEHPRRELLEWLDEG